MKPTLKPGWKMYPKQASRYWREVSAVCHFLGVTGAQAQTEVRKRLHVQAFGEAISAKEIDHLKMFDDFLAACAAITRPDDLGTQMRQAIMGRTRLKKSIQLLADDEYWQRIALDRFNTTDLDLLSDEQLTQLRNTVRCRSRIPKSNCPQRELVTDNQPF
jgi:hypothetical protein